MPLETATYVSDLNASAPAHSDGLNQADAHMRLIKAALKSTFAHTGQITNADNQLIPAAGSSTKPAYSFAVEPTLGFYRSAAGIVSLVGGKLAIKNILPAGIVQMFVALPASIGFATADTGKDWLELNGATYNRADYPDLADLINGVGVGTTFTLPDMTTTSRFPRSRSSTLTVRSTQANTVGPHTHPDVTSAAETQEHTHTFSGTTGTMNQNTVHSHTINGQGQLIVSGQGSGVGGGGAFGVGGSNQLSNSSANIDHAHAFSGTTAGRSATHNHVVSTPANTGTTETRPEAIAFVFAVKT